MDLSKVNWKELDINTDSLWLIGPRAKGGKRENNYHGNFVPQIPQQMIQRYTEEGSVVLDMFMGSGTTLYEAEAQKRSFIGFDINEEIISYVHSKMENNIYPPQIPYFIHNCDITNTEGVTKAISSDLDTLQTKGVDLIMCHPPYLDIVKFTDKAEDLSNISDIHTFTESFIKGIKNVWPFLNPKQYLVLVIGDLWRDKEVVPLGFILMNAIKQAVKCKLIGIVVKDIVGNRGKLGSEAIWRYRALKNGNYLFKHEYVFVFRKQ